jgi:hypothetical protein
MHLRTIYRDGWLCTAYEKSTVGVPTGLESLIGPECLDSYGIEYEGTEGELYNVEDDPHQWHNLWDDPAYRTQREELVEALRAALPGRSRYLPVVAVA